MQSLTTSSCTIGNTQIAYFAKGKGQPVLLVHGVSPYSFIWRKIVPLLDRDYQVLGIDLPGCGASGKGIEEPYSLQRLASLVNDFLEKREFKKYISSGTMSGVELRRFLRSVSLKSSSA